MNSSESIVRWNDIHNTVIHSKVPMSINKIGTTEAICIAQYLKTDGKSYSDTWGLNYSCGIYSSSHESHNNWCEAYINGILSSDFLHLWHEYNFKKNIDKQPIKNRLEQSWTDQFIYESLKNKMNIKNEPISSSSDDINPITLGEDAWHLNLKDKKVLVVSNAQKTFEYQAERYHKLWNGATLGGFEFVKIPSSEHLACDNPTNQLEWSKKVYNAKNEIAKKNFDFAIVGCGGIGLILTDYIKNTCGKSCTYLGGIVQLIFGIRGNRWEHCKGWYNSNDYWIKPFEEDIPKKYMIHENGSYWI